MQNPLQKLLGKLSPRSRFKKWLAFWFVLILGGYGVYFLFDLLEPERVLVTIGKETTYIDGPLKASGYPDYVAALNKLQSDGVTPENNAYILILQTVGPNLKDRGKNEIPDDIKEQYFKMVGIESWPDNGEYLQSFDEYIDGLSTDELPPPNDEEKSKDDFSQPIAIRQRLKDEAYDVLEKREWNPKKNSIVEKWFVKQEPVLKRLDGIDKRTKFYAPTVNNKTETHLYMADMPHLSYCRTIAYTLRMRILRSISLKQYDKAWSDCKIILKIANGCYSGPTDIDQLVGTAVENMVNDGILNFLVQRENITLSELDTIQNHYHSAGKIRFDRAIDIGRRYHYLDVISHGAEIGFDPNAAKDATVSLPFRQRKKFDYDLMLRDGNEFCDKVAKSFTIKDEKIRSQIVAEAYAEFEEYADRTKNNDNTLGKISQFFQSRYSRSKNASLKLMLVFSPAANAIGMVQDRLLLKREINNIGIAIARYHIKHGQYPVDFAELKSEGITKIPFDMFSKKPCIYLCDGKGFLIYSIGFNQVDEGGYMNDYSSDCDDIAVYSLNREPKAPSREEPDDNLVPPQESK